MIQNKNQNMLFTWMQIIYMVILCLNFFGPADSKEFNLNKYNKNI